SELPLPRPRRPLLSPRMTATLALLLALAAQPGPGLARGQELVYRGSYDEQASADGALFRRRYDLEALTFVLDAGSRGRDVAFCTTLRAPGADAPGSVRLELATLDARGRIALSAGGGPAPLI